MSKHNQDILIGVARLINKGTKIFYTRRIYRTVAFTISTGCLVAEIRYVAEYTTPLTHPHRINIRVASQTSLEKKAGVHQKTQLTRTHWTHTGSSEHSSQSFYTIKEEEERLPSTRKTTAVTSTRQTYYASINLHG